MNYNNNMNYNPNPYPNQNPNMYSNNMNYNANPNPNMYNNNINYNPNPSPFNNTPNYVQPQAVQPIIVSGCHKCGGTGFKIGKKGVRKVCKKCRGVPTVVNNNRQIVVAQPHLIHQRRTWCGCLKVSKKGYNKCKLAKGCNIF